MREMFLKTWTLNIAVNLVTKLSRNCSANSNFYQQAKAEAKKEQIQFKPPPRW